MKCPHCNVETIPHVDGLKAGTYHCNECGCCMTADGQNREGHSGCNAAGAQVAAPAPIRVRAASRRKDTT